MPARIGYIALLDVLGFSDNVLKPNFEDYLDDYKLSVTNCLNNKVGYGDVALEVLVFSDTILISTIDDNRQSFMSIVKACSRLFYLLLEKRIAIRGCVSHGSFMRDKMGNKEGSVILAGPTIIEAYKYEKNQNWVGIMLAPSVAKEQEEYLVKYLTGHFDTRHVSGYVQRYDKIPFQEGFYDGYAVIPSSPNIDDYDIVENNVCTWLDNLMLYSSEPKMQFKYKATKDWIKHVFGENRVIMNRINSRPNYKE